MSLEFLSDALHYGVHASSIEEVNDPYEFNCVENADNYRIACMTISNRKMLLWAYYTKHMGCCVEFNVPDEIKSIIRQVHYDTEFVERAELTVEEIIEQLGHKGNEWSHENEYRAIYYEPWNRGDVSWVHKRNSNDIFLKLPVKSVCFGLHSSMDLKYGESLSLLNEYQVQTGQKIEVKKVRISPRKYELIENKQFDFSTELRRVQEQDS